MKRLTLVLLVAFTGCAETRLYEHGQLVAVIQADATNISIATGSGFSFHADTLTHSTPTQAGYTGVTQVTGAVAAGVAGGLIAR